MTATDQYLDGQYLKNVPDWHAGDSPWKASQILRLIEKNRLSVRSVCDVGCGVGEVLIELQKKMSAGIRFSGFDISPQAMSIAKPKENARLQFHNDDFLTATGTSPDLVLLLDVFEHVSDYIGFLDRLRSKAAWIIFHIPLDVCAKSVLRKSWWALHMRQRYGHLHYFTKETAIAALSDIGYDIVDWFYTDDLQISDELIPEWFRPRFFYEVRKQLFRIHPDLAVSFFPSYNLLVLARGDRPLPVVTAQ